MSVLSCMKSDHEVQVRSVAAGSFFGRFAPSIGEMLSSPLAEFNE